MININGINMNYYYDTEFLEGTQKRWFGETKPTIDLISIGIVAEDGREYYAISKDFNLKEAWNRYDEVVNKHFPMGPEYNKVYWIRDNVLKPIYYELYGKDINFHNIDNHFTYKDLKKFIDLYGKSNKQIAKEVKDFCNIGSVISNNGNVRFYREFTDSIKTWIKVEQIENNNPIHYDNKPKLYGYYSAYDHVALCWLFGKMIDLPNGFPMYTIDLQQESDRIYNLKKEEYTKGGGKNFINKMSNHPDYPRQVNEHSAIHDARWNKQLYEFLNTLFTTTSTNKL